MAVDIIARAMAAEASSGGKDVDYGSVTNKPQINGITLEGNKTTSDLGIGEIIELKGTEEENPIELANIGEPGIYKISGYVKDLLTSSATDIGNDIILEVAKTNDAISQHYWKGNSAFRMKVRITISGIPFTENFHDLSQDGDIENYSSINAFSLITSLTLSRYLGRGYMGKVLLTDLKTTDKNSLVNAINELVDIKQDKLIAGSGITIENNVISALGGSGAFPIIDATGETEIDLDNYLDDGTWIIKGHNVKQIKEYSYTPAQETDWAMLEIKTQNWLSNGYVYQILQFPITAYNNGGLEKELHYGIRQIKPSIESMFKDSIIPISVTDYYDIFPDDGYQKVLSAMGSYNMYTALMSYLTNNINNKPRLSGLNTTDKTSLVNAINEVNTKISSGTFATNLAEVQGYDATKTQVLKNINGVLTWQNE